jgi:hypothetical protein
MPRRAGRGTPFRAELLPGAEADVTDGGSLFPPVAEEDIREAIFQLCWTQHGGSGLGWTRTEALELDLGELAWWLERIADQRAQEARAIEKASRA